MLENIECDGMWKADDDTYMDVDRLLAYDTRGRHYIGYGIASAGAGGTPYAHGGSGYFLSRAAMQMVVDKCDVLVGDEDRAVGTVLINNGMPLLHEPRLVTEFSGGDFRGWGITICRFIGFVLRWSTTTRAMPCCRSTRE